MCHSGNCCIIAHWTKCCAINRYIINHYSDDIMGAMASQITSLTIVYSTFILAQIKENIKAPRHWPLCGEFTRDRWILRTNGQQPGKYLFLMTSSCHKLCWNHRVTTNSHESYYWTIWRLMLSIIQWQDQLKRTWMIWWHFYHWLHRKCSFSQTPE